MDYFNLLNRGTSFKKVDTEIPATGCEDQQVGEASPHSKKKGLKLNFFKVKGLEGLLETKSQEPVNINDRHRKSKSHKQELDRSLFKPGKNNKVKIIGDDLPDPIDGFSDLIYKYKYKKYILENVKQAGYEEPLIVQKYTIPVLENRRDVIVRAPTGSGKTLAFLLPVINLLCSVPKSEKCLQAMIISPTRELCSQICENAKKFSKGKKIKIMSLCKLSKPQLDFEFVKTLSEKYHILISTPSKLCAAVKAGIYLHNLKYLILDEGDKLLSKNFLEQMTIIIKELSSETCKSLFSATINPYVEEISNYFLNNTVRVNIGKVNAASYLSEHKLVFVGSEEGKLLEIRKMVQLGFELPAIIFAQSIQRANNLFRDLIYDGINVGLIHAGRTKAQRDLTVKSFSEGKIWVLITSDLVARGIDFKNVNLVINYDFPQSVESYLHRAGRTGRGGKHGKVITFFTQDDFPFVRGIAAAIKASGGSCMNWISNIPKFSKNHKRKHRSGAHQSINSLDTTSKKIKNVSSSQT